MDSNDPLVSVLIPTFRRPKELRKALESVIAQTYANLEIIISNNDRENEETNAVCLEFAAKDKRVSYHVQPADIGGWGNQNFVIRVAKGEYTLIMGDDDWISDNFIELTLRVLQSDPKCGMVQGAYIAHTTEQRTRPVFVMEDNVHENCTERILVTLLTMMSKGIGPYHGLCRTSYFKSVVSDKKPGFGEDWTLVTKITSLGSIRSTSEAVYHKSIPHNRNAAYYADFFETPDINETNFFPHLFFGVFSSIAYDPFYDDKLDRLERIRFIVTLIEAIGPKVLFREEEQRECIKGIKSCLRYFWRHPTALFKKKLNVVLEIRKKAR